MSKKQIESGNERKSFALEKKFTVKEVADNLKKSTKTIYKWVNERKLKAYRFGSDILITESALNDFAKDHKLHNSFLYFYNQNNDGLNLAALYSSNILEIESLSEEEFLNAYLLVDIESIG